MGPPLQEKETTAHRGCGDLTSAGCLHPCFCFLYCRGRPMCRPALLLFLHGEETRARRAVPLHGSDDERQRLQTCPPNTTVRERRSSLRGVPRHGVNERARCVRREVRLNPSRPADAPGAASDACATPEMCGHGPDESGCPYSAPGAGLGCPSETRRIWAPKPRSFFSICS